VNTSYNWAVDMAVIAPLFLIALIGVLAIQFANSRKPKPRGATRVS